MNLIRRFGFLTLSLFPSKLRSRWDGPFVVQQVFPSGTVQIMDPQDGAVLIVNGQRLNPVVTHDIDPGLIESINLVDHVCYDIVGGTLSS